jgi:hypothetical protein
VVEKLLRVNDVHESVADGAGNDDLAFAATRLRPWIPIAVQVASTTVGFGRWRDPERNEHGD